MATKVTNAALIAEGRKLLEYAMGTTVPYVSNGMSLQGMDCQGLVEYCLIQAGVPKAECGLAGSNAHWRRCVWRGTPDECKAAFGCIPGGAALFIVNDDGGEPAKYQGDGLGNASHIGLWLDDTSIAASASCGQVIESNFAGKAINGGWNMIGLLPWVDYGLSEDQQSVVSDTEATSDESDDSSAQDAQQDATTVDTSDYYTIKRGCKGGAVARLQTWLNMLGYGLAVDHDFGPATEAAVIAFQQAQSLEADGIVGRQTWAALATARQAAQS